ncbi:MAG: DUF2510 domain-containing protein [Candidatus Nanopelagicales bacterium]
MESPSAVAPERRGTRRARIACLVSPVVSVVLVALGFAMLPGAQASPGVDATMAPGFAFISAVLAGIGAVVSGVGWLVSRARERRPPQPAGWYADPWKAAPWRYWDGTAWTDRATH